MNVLFVASGNKNNKINPIVINQGKTLEKNGINIDYFAIYGKGISGYLTNIPILRKFILKNKFDIIHAHYSKSAYVASISSLGLNVPVICSLMGSDIQTSKLNKTIIHFFYKTIWKATIVKSERMKTHINLKKVYVAPNGIELEHFNFIEKDKAQEFIGFKKNIKNLIWISDIKRFEKNFKLAKQSVLLLDENKIKLNVISGVNHEDIPKIIYAADVLLLTSIREGSPNVIKEAMACNVPIVSTDVGDVKHIIGDTAGCYICSYDPKDVAKKIKMALEFGKRTKGRQRIIQLGLDSKTIANKIINIYKELLNIK